VVRKRRRKRTWGGRGVIEGKARAAGKVTLTHRTAKTKTKNVGALEGGIRKGKRRPQIPEMKKVKKEGKRGKGIKAAIEYQYVSLIGGTVR